jgi:methionyl-tRNA formyltransferase
MSRIIIIGGIESTYRNAQLLYEMGEDILMFYTRGQHSPGWEGVDMIDESRYEFAGRVPRTVVNGNINEWVPAMRNLKPDFIWSLGWQQIYKKALLEICPVVGIHESLLPRGAGAVPIANAILHNETETGVSLFFLDNGMDTGPLIAQLKGHLSPQLATSTELYEEAMHLEEELLRSCLPWLKKGIVSGISQDVRMRTEYGKIDWEKWPAERVLRARTYPYI